MTTRFDEDAGERILTLVEFLASGRATVDVLSEVVQDDPRHKAAVDPLTGEIRKAEFKTVRILIRIRLSAAEVPNFTLASKLEGLVAKVRKSLIRMTLIEEVSPPFQISGNELRWALEIFGDSRFLRNFQSLKNGPSSFSEVQMNAFAEAQKRQEELIEREENSRLEQLARKLVTLVTEELEFAYDGEDGYEEFHDLEEVEKVVASGEWFGVGPEEQKYTNGIAKKEKAAFSAATPAKEVVKSDVLNKNMWDD